MSLKKLTASAFSLALCMLAACAILTSTPTKTSAATGQYGLPIGGLDAYRIDRDAAVFRAGLSTADTLTSAGILATTKFDCSGNGQGVLANIVVSARFSIASATASVQLAYIYTDSTGAQFVKGFSPIANLTGAAAARLTVFPAPDYLFDSEGSTELRVLLVTGTSSGTVDLWVGSY